MAELLSHRGPDRRKWSILPNSIGVFAHSRLRVIDLSTDADQPLMSEDGSVHMVFNGEIYNFQNLRTDLSRAGAPFHTTSDSEVVLRLYERRGPAALSALDGMFAIALFDARRRELLLMRDRIGKKPLYHAQLPGGRFAFASEIKALGAIPDFSFDPDPDRLDELLVFGYVQTPNSFVKGVHKLEPGTILRWSSGHGVRTERYWELPEPHSNHQVSLPDATEAVRHGLRNAVRRRLVADVPMGLFLSGGLDSSAIAHEMVEHTHGNVRSFAAGFPDDQSFDERTYARRVAQHVGTTHSELQVQTDFIDELPRLLWFHDEPYGDSSAIAMYGISELTRHHVTVVLTGDGGDELFGGYTRFLGAQLLAHVPAAARTSLKAVLNRLPEVSGYKNPISLLRRFGEHMDRGTDEQLLAWNTFFVGEDLRRLRGQSVAPWAILERQVKMLEAERAKGADFIDSILRHNFQTYLLDDLLVKTDRMTMAWGLEARSPFLDTKLIETIFRLPSHLKIRHGVLKWILKKAYRNLLPKEATTRRKHGFGVPVGVWWRSGRGQELVHDLLMSTTARCHSVLDSKNITTIIEEHESDRRDHGQRLFLLLQLEIWLQTYERQIRSRLEATRL